MLIGKLGAVAPLTAVGKICTESVRTNSNPEYWGIFVQIAVLYEICTSARHCGLSGIL